MKRGSPLLAVLGVGLIVTGVVIALIASDSLGLVLVLIGFARLPARHRLVGVSAG